MDDQSLEYSTEPVPDTATVSWFRVALVSSMVAFSLPTFLTGIEVAAVSSPEQTLSMLLVGSLILTALGSVTAGIGSSTRLSSYMLNRVAFGKRGAGLVNLAFALSLLGWFGVNIDLFSMAIQRLATDQLNIEIPIIPVELFAGVVMTVTTLYGFRAINFLSTLLVPVLVVVTILLISKSLDILPFSELMTQQSQVGISFGDGVSSVVGAVIVGAVILPDITRFIRHWSGAVYVVIINYLIVSVVVMGAGGMAAVAMGDDDLLNIMITLGIGWAAFAIVILGSWVLNSLNLYSTILSVESTVPRFKGCLLIVVMGGLGTVAAFFNILDYFLSFLFYLAIIFVPVSGVIAVDCLLLRRNAYDLEDIESAPFWRFSAIASWAIGAVIAALGSQGWYSLTSIAALDAVLAAAISYYLISRYLSGDSTGSQATLRASK